MTTFNEDLVANAYAAIQVPAAAVDRQGFVHIVIADCSLHPRDDRLIRVLTFDATHTIRGAYIYENDVDETPIYRNEFEPIHVIDGDSVQFAFTVASP